MNDLEELYENGLSLPEMLRIADNKLGKIIDGEKITDAIKRCRHEIEDERRFISYNRGTPQEIDTSKKTIEDNKILITELEDKLLNALYDNLKTGHFAILGLTSRDSSGCPIAIQIEDWRLLEIENRDTGIAYYNNQAYWQIIFVPLAQLKQHQTGDNSKAKLTLEQNSKISIESNTEQAKVKLEDVPKQTNSNQHIGTKKRTRDINLKKALKAAMEDLNKKPRAKELLKYFEDGKDTTDFIESVTNTHVIWIDTKGIVKETTRQRVATMLSTLSYP